MATKDNNQLRLAAGPSSLATFAILSRSEALVLAGVIRAMPLAKATRLSKSPLKHLKMPLDIYRSIVLKARVIIVELCE